jgi:signal transduction histidine kinase
MDEFSAYGKLKKLESEEMDLSLLLEDISHVLTPIFKEDNAILDIPKIKELYIKGDYNKLKQVFINLLKNTLEAKKENRQLVVNIKLKEYKENILISINDNGIGMSENTLSKIYEVFYTTKPQGTGLGLTFSKEVIELHQGTINIKSEKDKGTNIIIRLPK